MLAGLAVLASAAGPALAAPIGTPPRVAIRALETVAARFYDLYVKTLAADQDALSDRYERFSAYIARLLVEQLLQRLQGPRAGMSAAAPDAAAPAARTPFAAAPDHGHYFVQADLISTAPGCAAAYAPSRCGGKRAPCTSLSRRMATRGIPSSPNISSPYA